jgi:hypothetical protein
MSGVEFTMPSSHYDGWIEGGAMPGADFYKFEAPCAEGCQRRPS